MKRSFDVANRSSDHGTPTSAINFAAAFGQVPRHVMQRIDLFRGLPCFMGRQVWAITFSNCAQCLAVTNAGIVYVMLKAVEGYFNIQMFSLDGTPLGLWGAIPQGNQQDEMFDPVHMAVAPTGEVIIADIKLDKVLVFCAQGIFSHTLASPAGTPFHIALSLKNEVAVVGQEQVQMRRLRDGALLRTMTVGSVPTWFPVGVVFLPDDKVGSKLWHVPAEF